MEESSMSSTMLMATMVAPSWMSNMMGRLITLNTLDMVDMCRSYLTFIIKTIYQYRNINSPSVIIVNCHLVPINKENE